MPFKQQITYTSLISGIHYHKADADRREVAQLLQQAQAIPHQLLPFKGIIHVIDYTQHKHICISGPFTNMIGYHPRDVLDNGLGFVIGLLQKDDFSVYNTQIFPGIIQFLKNTPQAAHEEYLFSFSYRLRRADGSWMQTYQQCGYLTDPATHLPRYCIGVVSDVSAIKHDSCMALSIDRRQPQESLLSGKNIETFFYYPDAQEEVLSRREREVAAWLADGFSSKQVAGKLNISENTVVNHRKNILRKTNTRNTAGMIRVLIQRGII